MFLSFLNVKNFLLYDTYFLVYPKSCQELNEYFQINFGWYFISKDGVTVQKVLCYFERNKGIIQNL